MKKIVTTVCMIALMIMANNTFAKTKTSSPATASAKKIPGFSLKDPDGHVFTSKGLLKDGLVLVVTAPIMKNKGAQEGWEKYLSKARSGSKAKWVYLEDMTPSFFKNIALKRMKKDYTFGKEPILLIDKSGEVRRSLGVQNLPVRFFHH